MTDMGILYWVCDFGIPDMLFMKKPMKLEVSEAQELKSVK
jgi:hypothetical protein